MKQPIEGRYDDLLNLMRAGDEEAFALIYRRHQGEIYRFALQMTGDSCIAEDVTQEVFMALIRELNQFDPSRGSLRAFLYGVARNHVMRRLERERGYVALEDDSRNDRGDLENGSLSSSDPHSEFARQEDVKRVREAVLSLPAAYREVVVLCDLEEKNYAEAAQALGCAVGTVRSRLHRARSLLVRKLSALRQVHDEAERLSAAEGKS